MDGKGTAVTVIVCDFEMLLHIFERQNVHNGMIIEPDFAIVAHEGFLGCIENATIPVDCHLLVYIPDFGNKSQITEKIT